MLGCSIRKEWRAARYAPLFEIHRIWQCEKFLVTELRTAASNTPPEDTK
jgi:hypothetical protein